MSSARSSLSVLRSLRAIILLSCLLSQLPLAQSEICYDRTGLQNEKCYPCEPDAKYTSCCAPGDICFSNGLCSPGPALRALHTTDYFITPFYWNGCTDPTFKDPRCFTACFNSPGLGVQSCPEAGPNAYCCFGYSGCDCTDPNQVVTALAGSIVATIDLGVSTSSPHTSSSTSNTDVPSSTSTSKDSTATTTAPETSTAANTSQSQGSKSSAVPIGVGVGVGGAALIAVAAAAFFLLRRRRQKAQKAPYLGPKPKYETKPDGLLPEMMTGHNTAELPSPRATPMYELPAPK